MHWIFWVIAFFIWKQILFSITDRYVKYKWAKKNPFDAITDALFAEALDLHNRAYFRNAIAWYTRLFNERCDPRAACNLGCILARNNDFELAKPWFKKAHEKGNLSTAQFNLGLIAEKENNFSQACYWYRHSLDNGYTIAGTYLRNMQFYEREINKKVRKNKEALKKHSKTN